MRTSPRIIHMGSVFDSDRRRFKQFPENVAIKFRRLDLSGAIKETKALQATVASAEHISDIGVFLSTGELQEVDTVIEIVFTFSPQGREVKSLARVAWKSREKGNKGIGIELFKLSQELYANIITRAKRGHWILADQDTAI